jgi:NAD(P)-dependent dehydrogenase (short-subunit alcohol dehydrogenase family)
MIHIKRVYEPAEPGDIVNLALFLASGGSDYVSGAAIVIDGGWVTT